MLAGASLYDLLDAGVPDVAIDAWLAGHDSADMCGLPRLSPRERRTIADSWWFWARPGQAWTPGPEFITDHEAGRGWGKNFGISQEVAGPTIAGDPERWGGHAIIVGPDPTQVKRDCLFGPSGIFAAAERASRSGNGPGIVDRNLVDRWLRFEAPRGGGGAGLTVYWASSYDPKSVHGANVGLVWWDEFGVSYHDRQDEQGNNAWRALLPAVRAGPDPKVIITQTPSRRPEVRALQRDAERPECKSCRAADLEALGGRWLGEVGKEPWRLPRSPQRRLHPLLDTRTTEPLRECPRCKGAVTARVRCVFGATTDNPAIAAVAREAAAAELATGSAPARLRFAPRGEVDSTAEGALLREEDVARVPVEARDGRPGGQVPDRWAAALDDLGVAPGEVVVVVDPAVTSSDGSDETGVVAAGTRRVVVDGRDVTQCVGLQDASASPAEVAAAGGPPSGVWAPRAHLLAVLWGAPRIVVEVNQGGDEVLHTLRELTRRRITEAEAMTLLRAHFADLAGVSDARLGLLARRVSASSAGIRVEALRRRAPKAPRFEWAGDLAARGGLALAGASWLGGATHWSHALGQGTGYEPPREGDASRRRDRKDRWDAVVSAAQVLLGARETHRGEVEGDARPESWLGRASMPG